MKLSDNARKRIGIFLILPVLLITLAYAGGYISQFIINYKVWTAAGGTPGNGTAPEFPSGSPAACFRALTVFPYSLYGFFLCVGIFALLIFLVMRMGYGSRGTYDRDRNLTYSDKGTYGTSGFMTDAEMRQVLEVVPDISKSRGVILGKLHGKAVCLPEKTRMNRNVAVFGASGKGTVFVRLQIGVNAIAHSCYDSRMPGKKDDVSFVVTRIDEERNVAVGLISRIIRQNI